MARLIWVYALLYTFLLLPRLNGQEDAPSFVRYTVREGLSDNYITGIAQDSFGFIWIGTDNGLNRFDGYVFEHSYTYSPLSALISPAIRSLKMLPDARLGLMTKSGFQRIDVNTLDFDSFLVPDSTPFASVRNRVWDAEMIDSGKLAITTATGFYVFRADGTLHFRHDAYAQADRLDKRILYGREIFTLPGGDILAYVEQREVAHYDARQNTFRIVNPDDARWSSFCHPPKSTGGYWSVKAQIGPEEFVFVHPQEGGVYDPPGSGRQVVSALPGELLREITWESSMALINDSTLAVTSGISGFYFLHLDRKTGKIEWRPEKVLPDFKINVVFADRDARLWIGTTAGLLREKLYSTPVDIHAWASGGAGIQAYSAAYAYGDQVYLGRIGPDTNLLVLDAHSLKVVNRISFPYTHPEWQQILAMEMYHPDTLWIATGAGMLWLDTKTGRLGKVRDLGLPAGLDEMNYLAPPHPDGSAWMLRKLHGKVARYDMHSRTLRQWDAGTPQPLPFLQVKHIAYDAYGDVWIGGHGLARWSRHTRQFDTVMTVYAGHHPYEENILAMTADPNGSLWLHNAVNGLLRYHIRERRFVHLGLADGLPSMVLNSFSPVIEDHLYIASPHHVFSVNTVNHEVNILADEHDLPESPPFSRQLYYDKTAHRVLGFYPEHVIRFPILYPERPGPASRLIIKQVLTNHTRSWPVGKNILKLQSSERNISIAFSLIDFEQGGSHRFAYRLSPSAEWIPIGTQRFLHLTNLVPGTYHLELRATGRDPSQYFAKIHFVIRAPFWRQPWFYLLAAILATGGAWLLVRLQVSRIRIKAEMDAQIADAEMKALHAQMNPHFVFNSLNSIKQMILQRELSDASRYLSDFAQLIRMTLHQSRKPFISLRETLDYLRRYVAMEKIRNPDFAFEMHADASLDPDETILPPMLIQPFIENAIWHGPGVEGRPISIRAEFRSRGDHLECIVEDDGVGFPPTGQVASGAHGHVSVGISNIRKRIELLNQKHNLHSSLSITNNRGVKAHGKTGTRVCITLPLEILES